MKFVFAINLLLLFFPVIAYSQDSVLIKPSPSVPQEKPHTPSNGDRNELTDRVEVDKAMLPPKLKEILKEEKYAGWEKSPVYFEQKTDQYILLVIKDNTTQTFRFTKKGEPITTGKPLEEVQNKQ